MLLCKVCFLEVTVKEQASDRSYVNHAGERWAQAGNLENALQQLLTDKASLIHAN